MINFIKFHGCGNDYLYIDNRQKVVKKPAELSPKMSKPHFGVGSDGIILLEESLKADFKMRIFNADGSEAEMCGNGIRCFGKFIYDYQLSPKTKLEIETLAGIKTVDLKIKNKKAIAATVDMGEPKLERSSIPMLGGSGTVIDEPLFVQDGTVKFEITAVSMGNPHAIIFVDDVENFPLEKYGPLIESHDLFPNNTNVEIVQVVSETEVIQRTWERGSNETLACGTGASAVTVACVLNGKTKREITVHLRGGDLQLKWDSQDNHVYKQGPAEEVFTGSWPE